VCRRRCLSHLPRCSSLLKRSCCIISSTLLLYYCLSLSSVLFFRQYRFTTTSHHSKRGRHGKPALPQPCCGGRLGNRNLFLPWCCHGQNLITLYMSWVASVSLCFGQGYMCSLPYCSATEQVQVCISSLIWNDMPNGSQGYISLWIRFNPNVYGREHIWCKMFMRWASTHNLNFWHGNNAFGHNSNSHFPGYLLR